MDGPSKLSPQQLIDTLRREFEKALVQVDDAGNAAPGERVISDAKSAETTSADRTSSRSSRLRYDTIR